MPKQDFSLKCEVINKNVNKTGGNVQFAVGVEAADNKTTARKVINFQSTDRGDLAHFEPGDTITITFTK